MLPATQTLLIALLLLVFYQDIKYRSVSLILFILLHVVSIIKRYYIIQSDLIIGIITSLVTALLIIALLLFYIVFIKKINIKNYQNQIGLGDILFFVIWALLYEVELFLKLFVAGMIASLFIQLLVIEKLQKGKGVPLAGLNSLFIIAIELASISGFINLS